MTSFYHSDQSDLCNGGRHGDFGSEYCNMASNTVNWQHQPQPQMLQLPQNSYPYSKMTEDPAQFYGYCPSTTPLSSSSTPTSPLENLKMEPEASEVQQGNGTETSLSDDQLVRMSVRDLNYLLQVGSTNFLHGRKFAFMQIFIFLIFEIIIRNLGETS